MTLVLVTKVIIKHPSSTWIGDHHENIATAENVDGKSHSKWSYYAVPTALSQNMHVPGKI
jgi:hypothetical protein